MIKATGYYILVELEAIEETTASGIIVHSRESQEKEQRGHHKGEIISFGPLCFAGYSGVDNNLPVEERAKQWGVQLGDVIECGRYAGEMVQKEGIDRYMLIPDQKIMGAYDE